ncbi:MAG: hypothetical protein DKT66_22540 [Candidatus Melainabacteria bacterium]|nr:MAG: hypothetical protein DKT66_22540 [Candidatus Melainabacteria bacterium]
MNESQTRLLIQRELDGNLSQEEEMRLRRVLMVNDSAVSFRANLSQIVAAVHDLELPDSVRPGDSSRLAVEIIDSLPNAKASFWEPLLDIFISHKNRKNDPRSTRSVASNPATRLKASASTGFSAGYSAIQQNTQGTNPGTDSSHKNRTLSNSGAQSKIDPAVLSPKKEHAREQEKEKTPNGLQAVDQYVTGTHSAIGGLGKKLNIHKNSQPVEEVGKTLAEAIREKVHEHLREEAEHAETNSDYLPEEVQELPIELQTPGSTEPPPAVIHEAALPITSSPNIVSANITMQQLATPVNLGVSMVVTVSPQVQNVSTQSHLINGHDFSDEQLMEWKSGTYPTVAPPAKPAFERQTETGPLAPFSVKAAPNISNLNLKNTSEIMKQLAEDAQKEIAPQPQWKPQAHWTPQPQLAPQPQWAPAPPAVPAPASEPVSRPNQTMESQSVEIPQPTIVAVTRANALPIDAIGDRINQLFNEPVYSNPPSASVETSSIPAQAPAVPVEHPRQNSALETDVNQCLSSLGRLADFKYATNNPGNIKELGRFLLTEDAIEKIDSVIKKGLGHSHARVVTLDAAQQLAMALEPILKIQGVLGYMVCGYDGLPISSALPQDVDIELLGGCTLVSYMNSHHIIMVMGHSRIKQIVMQTQVGSLVLADFGKGILATLTGEKDPAVLTRLSETISSITGD